MDSTAMADLKRGKHWVEVQFEAAGVEPGAWRLAGGGLNYDLWQLELRHGPRTGELGFNEGELIECGSGNSNLRSAVRERISHLVQRWLD